MVLKTIIYTLLPTWTIKHINLKQRYQSTGKHPSIKPWLKPSSTPLLFTADTLQWGKVTVKRQMDSMNRRCAEWKNKVNSVMNKEFEDWKQPKSRTLETQSYQLVWVSSGLGKKKKTLNKNPLTEKRLDFSLILGSPAQKQIRTEKLEILDR